LADVPAARPATRDTKYYLLRTHETPSGPFYEALMVTTYDSPGDFTTYVIRRKVFAGRPEIPPEEQARLRRRGITEAKAQAIHFSLIAPLLREDIAKYRDRRDWPASVRRKLWKTGKDYLNDSIYIAVVRKRTRELVGGMRLIQAPYAIASLALLGRWSARVTGRSIVFATTNTRRTRAGCPCPRAACRGTRTSGSTSIGPRSRWTVSRASRRSGCSTSSAHFSSTRNSLRTAGRRGARPS
jgi:hypothetical protein